MEGEIAGVADKRGGVVVLLNVLFEGWLGFGRPNGVVVSRQHQALHPLGKQFEKSCKFTVLGKQVGNGEFLVLTGIDANAIHAVSREDEVLDRLRKRVGVEPAYHLVPLGLEEGLRPHVNVGEERHAHAGFGADLVVLVFEGEMEVIDVENVACLTERTGDTHDVVGHQSCFQNLLVGTVSIVTAPLREQTGHLACFIL